MRELSLHILDLVENSITAGASCITIRVEESSAADRLQISVHDDGRGMPAQKAHNVENPFVTSRTTRRVGLGLSLIAAAARQCEGDIRVSASPEKGTEVSAFFRRSHIDRAPLGDMAATLGMLIMGNPHIDFAFIHKIDDREFTFDTRELKCELEDVDLGEPKVVARLMQSIRRSLRELASGENPQPIREKADGEADD